MSDAAFRWIGYVLASWQAFSTLILVARKQEEYPARDYNAMRPLCAVIAMVHFLWILVALSRVNGGEPSTMFWWLLLLG